MKARVKLSLQPMLIAGSDYTKILVRAVAIYKNLSVTYNTSSVIDLGCKEDCQNLLSTMAGLATLSIKVVKERCDG